MLGTMTIQQWILNQNPQVQAALWRQITHLLSDMELRYVMTGVREGRDMMALHEELEVFTKYQVDLLKAVDAVRRRFPEEIR